MEIMLPSDHPQDFVTFEHDGKMRRMYGGSFFHAPEQEDYFTVNLMKEYPLPSTRYVPIPDFSQPSNADQFIQVFEEILNQPKDVYVGCFGGKGRTGLFMACFLKYLGEEYPLERVRHEYNPHAVETEGQWMFLEGFSTREELLDAAQGLFAGGSSFLAPTLGFHHSSTFLDGPKSLAEVNERASSNEYSHDDEQDTSPQGEMFARPPAPRQAPSITQPEEAQPKEIQSEEFDAPQHPAPTDPRQGTLKI